MYELLTNATEQHHPEVFAELQGISDEFSAAGHIVSVHYLVAWLWFHELAHTELSTATDRGTKRVHGCPSPRSAW